jgi:UDP-N-acetylglucosamine 1-carboxyvinyltransferase
MDVLRIEGGTPLTGTIQVSGSKNAALPIFAATLLTEDPCILNNVPELSDIYFMTQIMEHLGSSITRGTAGSYQIQTPSLKIKAPYELVRKMRASICLLGPLIGRMRAAEVSLPGGCVIGQRPIDLHIKGLKKLGCETSIKNGYVYIRADKIKGTHIFLGGRQGSTVLGTANLLMAATLTPGVTCIESAACEPEIVDLCHMLTKMGALIEGIGSHTLTINGVDRLHGCTHSIIPDRIEAGTYLIAGAMTRGNLTVKGAQIRQLGALNDKLSEARVHLEVLGEDTIRVDGKASTLTPIDLITLPHPGFPTDLQAQMCALMSVTPGLSVITERIYPNRFMHVPELQRMGANISIEGASAIIQGGEPLFGAPVMASDLRASAALVLAGLAAQETTWVQRIYHLDRGYQTMEKKLQTVGASIERLPQTVMPAEFLD